MNVLALFEADVHSRLEVELWVAGVGVLLVGFFLARLVRDLDGNSKKLRTETRRVDRHEVEIVDKLRDGKQFPPLTDEE